MMAFPGNGDIRHPLFDVRFSLLFLALCLGITPVATAGLAGQDGDRRLFEERMSSGPTPAELASYAYAANPAIASARAAWRAAVEQYRVTTGLPDPQVMGTWYPDPIETRLGPQDWNITVTQMFPFPGTLSKAGEVVRADVRAAQLELDKAVRDVVAQIRESASELAYIRGAKKALDQSRDLLDQLRRVAETAYAGDRATLTDVAKAQSQSAQLMYDRLLLDELESTEIARLNVLLDRAPDAPVGPVAMERAQLAFSFAEISDVAQMNRQEIAIAGAMVEKARAKAGLAWYQSLPEFRVGLFYGGIGEPDVAVRPAEAGRDAVGIQMGVSIPLWLGKSAGRIEQAEAEQAKAEAMRRLQVNDTRAMISAAWFRLQNAGRLVRLYQDQLIPQAARSMELAETWYRQGQGSFSDYVETHGVWINFQLALLRAQADHEKYLARLERLAGRSLTWRESGDQEPARPEAAP
ncbi:MAG: TolC family protein [Thermodesulfobacteriota bacterium]